MTDNIPEHLIDAAYKAWDKSETGAIYDPGIIAAVLAALRPEDARYVPAWEHDKATFTDGVSRTSRLLDEARAELGRVKRLLPDAAGITGADDD